MRFRAGFSLLLALALAVSAPGLVVGVHAEPTRADLQAAEERLFELEREFSLAVEAYHQAQEEHAAVVAEISRLRDGIAGLNRGIASQAGEVARVVRSLYQGSSIRGIQSLLETSEFSDLHRRASYLQSAQQFQQGVLERFAADRKVLDAEVAELEVAEGRAAALDAGLAEQAREIEARLAAEQAEVAALAATLERLERERAEREAAERAAREAAARAAAEQAAREAAAREAAAREAAARETAAQASPAREVADRPSRDTRPEPQPEPQPAPQPAPQADPEPEPEPEPEPAPEPSPVSAPEPSSAAQVAVEAARTRLGMGYRWGASGPDNFDCSGLTSWAWAQAGVSIPRSSGAQYAGLPKVDRANLRPGDLLFFGSPIHHVGMYVGGGQMIEAPYTGQAVRYRSIDRTDYVGAVRPG